MDSTRCNICNTINGKAFKAGDKLPTACSELGVDTCDKTCVTCS